MDYFYSISLKFPYSNFNSGILFFILLF